MSCEMCGKQTDFYTIRSVNGKSINICSECDDNLHYQAIEQKLESVKEPRDFKCWDNGDMSDAFWLHLGKYKKQPNKKSISIMKLAFLWAAHADHGLSSSFYHALKWCGIDLFREAGRTDLKEE